jgi:beta-phosphoglucomutase-like phosphatase (HAD superfamily)
MTELVIFDCDGVLVDSEPISIRIDVEMFAEVGMTVSEQEVIDRFVGRSPELLAHAVEERLGHPPPDGWEERGDRRLRFKLELTGLYERFAGRIFSAAEMANGKPAPDLFLYAAGQMGVDPASCVVVEDSRYGVQAARAAGMDVLAYAGGLTPADVLAGPRTTVFDDMRSLPGLLR